MADAISRNVDGVLGNPKSLNDESYGVDIGINQRGLLEAPNFAKPIKFNDLNGHNATLPRTFLNKMSAISL